MVHLASPPQTAAPLYTQRRDRALDEAGVLTGRERSIGNLRLAVFVAGLAIAWLALDFDLIPDVLVGLPLLAFVVLILQHNKVIEERAGAERRADHYAHGLARLDGSWPTRGVRGEGWVDDSHPYSSDLDIFGDGSLFQLLCTARSATGTKALADWLRAPSDPAEIAQRQAAVRELTADVDRRERVAMIGQVGVAEVDPDYLVEWAQRPSEVNLGRQRLIAVGLVTTTVLTYVLQGLGVISPNVFLAALGLQAVFGSRRRDANREVTRSLELAAAELHSLTGLLGEIEQSSFDSEKLKELQRALGSDSVSASQRIRELHKLIQLLDARRNILFAPISIFFLWTSQLSMAVETWRARHGGDLAGWLDAVGQFETLIALSGFAYERASHSFPTIKEGPAEFVASSLQHPLMSEQQCVANDVRLDEETALLLVSGSNMSGKSTLLRTIGTNAVLAQMGGPVCAARLTMSTLQIATSMRTQDSLLDGTSRFYAEIKRLKQIVDQAGGSPPLLFMLDEVLHGTNSHDRRIGAEAVVENLVQRGAIGLVTTHDLTLAEITDHLAPRARNVHFADQLVDGEMIFDYRMHDGPVQRSNALGLMRAIGLDV